MLELGEPIDGGGCYYVYDGKGRTSGALARQIAARTAGMGQPGVQLIGPEDKPVRRIVLGTGAGTPMFHFIEKLGADMAICVDDGITYWRDGAYAIDTGFPVAVVNHPVAEEYSMKLLAGFLSKKLPQVPAHHIPERCMYRLGGRKGKRVRRRDFVFKRITRAPMYQRQPWPITEAGWALRVSLRSSTTTLR